MKEVVKCSISGVAFTMDNDAYQTLKEYLDKLKANYKSSTDGAEIVADIEARIAELILSAQDNNHVVEKPLVCNIIAQMGAPEDIAGEFADDEASSESRFPRRLYRDTENAKLGGVCAGVGHYFDIDSTWVRLGLFAPLVLMLLRWIPFMNWAPSIFGNLFLILVLCYLIMWFAVPVARTARQRLEMNGERITVQSIREAQSSAQSTESRAKPIVAEAVSIFGQIVLVGLKMVLGFMVFGLIIAACSLIVGLFIIIISGAELFGLALPSVWVPLLGIFVALIPIGMLIYVFMCMIASRKPGGRTILILFLLWIASIIACSSVAISEQFSDRVTAKTKILERIVNGDIVINGDTTSVFRMLHDEQIESELDDDAKTLHINVPDKQINITVDKSKASLTINERASGSQDPAAEKAQK